MGLINIEIIKQEWKEQLFVCGMFLCEMKLHCKKEPFKIPDELVFVHSVSHLKWKSQILKTKKTCTSPKVKVETCAA